VLTRLEAHGFKNLLGFRADFGPFTCLAGPNGVGKSNIFDAVRFLSLLADHTLMEAALSVAVNGTWRVEGASDRGVGQAVILDYLEVPQGRQRPIRFPEDPSG